MWGGKYNVINFKNKEDQDKKVVTEGTKLVSLLDTKPLIGWLASHRPVINKICSDLATPCAGIVNCADFITKPMLSTFYWKHTVPPVLSIMLPNQDL